MVFESLVVELLNKFLGDYIENLDASQLKLGIFGGDVKLENLNVKPTALDDLDLPVKLKSGFLGKLSLKIPWRNLYKEAVEAEIDGVYILVVPNKGVVFNAEKVEKQYQETKQKELKNIEDARKARKKKLEEEQKKAKGEKPVDDTFAEKMAAQIIRNLQVTVTNIHVRFEDEFTNRERPFASGITLDSLHFQTTDDQWTPRLVTEAIDQVIYKLIGINNASVYWNSGCELMSHLKNTKDIRERMTAQIAKADKIPSDYNYIVKPITLAAHLTLVQRPELDMPKFSRYKVNLSVQVPDIGLHVSKFQYQDALLFIEAMELMSVSAKYKAYRPNLNVYKGHYREWWLFAYNAILEEQVRRKRRNWSWERMKRHRALVNKYVKAWIAKRTEKNIPKEAISTIEKAEHELDVFNLNIARQQAEIEIDKRGLTRLEDQQSWGGWAGSFFGSGSSKQPKKITDQFNEAMDSTEKQKLYEALEYEEGEAPVDMPVEYVALNLGVHLDMVTVVVEDDKDGKKVTVLALGLAGVGLSVQQRPTAAALKANVKMESFEVNGIGSTTGQIVPMITMTSPDRGKVDVKPNSDRGKEPLLTVLYETNPLDKSCDQNVKLHTHPINVIYHAATINNLIEIFRPPEAVALRQLTTAAMAKYDEIIERSATGLEFALKKRTVMQLDIDVQPTRVIVPDHGVYREGANLLVLDLGSLKITTEGIGKKDIENVEWTTESDRYQKLLRFAYDNFRVELTSMQVVFAGPNDDWKSALREKATSMHVLRPTGLSILLQRCTITDKKLPKMRLSGELPDLAISLSQQRVLDCLKLALSIPTPPPGPSPKVELNMIEEPTLADRARLKTIMEVQDAEIVNQEDTKKDKEIGEKAKAEQEQAGTGQQTTLELDMTLRKISVSLSRELEGKEVDGLAFEVSSIGCYIQMRTYDTRLSASLGNIEVRHDEYQSLAKSGPLCLVENPHKTAKDKPLITLEIIQADRMGPDFASVHNLTEIKLATKISSLHFCLHQKALMDIQRMLENLSAELNKIQKEKEEQMPVRGRSETPEIASGQVGGKLSRPGSFSRLRSNSGSSGGSRSASRQSSLRRLTSRTGGKGRRLPVKDTELGLEERIIGVKIDAELGEILVTMGQNDQILSDISVRGLKANLSMRKSKLHISAVLKELGIRDAADNARHKQILAVEGENVFALDLTKFQRSEMDRANMGVDDVDMDVKLQFNRLRFIFLNLWLTKMMGWAKPFQAKAEEAADKAGAAAAENAATKAQELYKAATKIRLDVSISAPLIVMPRNSQSNDTLLVNLGKLTVKSKFSSEAVPNSKSAAVIEQLWVSLTEVRVARGILAAPGNVNNLVQAECRIVEPVTFELNVQRNLTFEWFKVKPEIAINGNLPLIKLGMTQEDYNAIIAVLGGNLAEVSDLTPTKVPSVDKENVATVITDDEIKPQVIVENASEIKVTLPEQLPIIDDVTTSRLTFDFKVEGVEASLYMGSSNLKSGVAERDLKRSLGCVKIQNIDAQGRMRVDASMDAKVSLANFIMDDLRPGQEGRITRMMDKKVGKNSDGEKLNFLDIKVTLDAHQNQSVDMKLRSFYVCVNADFVAAIAVFFTPARSEEELLLKKKLAENKKVGKKKAKREPRVIPERRKSTLNVNIIVEEPEFMIVEDAAHPLDTKALILRFKFGANMKNTPDQDLLQASLEGLELFTSYYNRDKRDAYHVPVLKPVFISVIGNQPFAQGLRMDVSISDLIVKISASVVQLLSGVAIKFTELQKATDEELGDKKKRTKRTVWGIKSTNDKALPFLTEAEEPELGQSLEDKSDQPDLIVTPGAELEEQLVIKLNTLVVTMEGGVGSKTVPLIFLQAAMHADVRNWSSKLYADGALTLELAYYNERFAAWEPMVEPVEANGAYRPWELQFTAQNCGEFEVEDIDDTFPPPEMALAVTSTDMLQLTFTKSAFQCVSKLGQVFNDAAKQSLPALDDSSLPDAPYVIVNDTGIDVTVLATDSLQIIPNHGNPKSGSAEVKLSTSQFVAMKPALSTGSVRRDSLLTAQDAVSDVFIKLKFPDMQNTIREIDVSRSEARYFTLPKATRPGDTWGLVVDTTTKDGRKTVYVRSSIRVHNHLDEAMELYNPLGTDLECCATAEAGKLVNVPFPAMYTESGNIFYKPASGRYEVSAEAMLWRLFGSNSANNKTISCASVDNANKRMYIEVCAEVKSARFENTNRTNITSQTYVVHLWPSVTFNNMLPVPVVVTAPDCEPFTLDKGEGSPLYAICPELNSFTVETHDFTGEKWTCSMKVAKEQDELEPRTFVSDDGKKKDFALHTLTKNGSKEVTLFCPYWMVNQTGLSLAYKISGVDDGVVQHPADFNEPVMLSFSGKNMHEQKKALLQVEDSDWSDKFPLDIVGSSGRVACKTKQGRKYEVCVRVSLSNSGLTKIVTLTPFYLLDNRCRDPIMIRECNSESMTSDWIRVEDQQCIPFWPLQTDPKKMMLCAKYEGSDEATQVFPYTESFEVLLKLENPYHVGMYMTCSIGESAAIVTLEDYSDGQATALIVNTMPNHAVKFGQAELDNFEILEPETYMMFAWQSLAKKKELVWSCGDTKGPNISLTEDMFKDFSPAKGEKCFRVSFLSGRQRVLLFTDDIALATIAQKAYEMERISNQVTLSLEGVGVSLVNNLIRRELLYFNISSSGVVWESRKSGRYKPLTAKDSDGLELAYEKWEIAKAGGQAVKDLVTVEKMEVDFGSMLMHKPHKRDIRRSFQTGLWVQLKLSEHSFQLHAKIQRAQLDNQLPFCVFPTVFHVVVPPKSVAGDSIPKPFVEVSMVMRRAEIAQVKYFKVLIQEMDVKADSGFIYAVLDLFASETVESVAGVDLITKDLLSIQSSLKDLALATTSNEEKTFFDCLHFSPIKVHLSFSQGGSSGNEAAVKRVPLQATFFTLLLKSVGVTVTELQDIIFKLGYFERSNVLRSRQQLSAETVDHYTKQAIKQFYVLVLGLDVIGNPFGLVRNLGEGVQDFFYEPIQGAIQGPEEFAEGLVLGMRSLFGHTVGGAAGAVGRITGTLGKGIAALTMDEEYQRKRQQAISRKPKNFNEGMARSGGRLVSGVFEGITGVVNKPMAGAKQEGAVGFAKGMGKGLIGLVARPMAGVVDCASGTLDAVKSVADVGEEVKRSRQPRNLHADFIVRPYSAYEAAGCFILQNVSKGKFSETDEYVVHAPVANADAFIATDHHVMLVSKSSLFGQWNCDWSVRWDELSEEPALTAQGLKFVLKAAKKKTFGFIGSGSAHKYVTFKEKSLSEFVTSKVVDAYKNGIP